MLLTTVVAATPDLREPVAGAEPVAVHRARRGRHLFISSIFSPLGGGVRRDPGRDRADRLVLAEGAQAPPGAGDLMILEPRFTDDVSPTCRPTSSAPSSLTWWGIIGFMVIEGAPSLCLRRLFLPDGP